MSPNKEQWREALLLLWDRLEKTLPAKQLDELTEGNGILEQLHEFGVTGPIGLGIGVFGGHAVD